MGSITTRTMTSAADAGAVARAVAILAFLWAASAHAVDDAAPDPQPAATPQAAPLKVEGTNKNPLTIDARAGARQGFSLSLETSETYVDNVTLARQDDPKTSSFITQVIPGIRYDANRGRFQASAEYSLAAVDYSDDHGRDVVFNRFDGIARGEVIPDLFYIEGRGAVGQRAVTPDLQAGGLESILDTGGNLVNAYTAAIAPYIRKQIDETIFNARYTYGFVRYSDVGGRSATAGTGGIVGPLPDSRNNQIYASWGNDVRTAEHVTWQISYDRQKADYDTAPSFIYEQSQLQLGWKITRDLTLLVNGGQETEAVPTAAGATPPRSTYWQAGFDYQVSRAQEVRALGGHRFYGNAYDFLYRFTGKNVTFWTTYVEGPTTASDELFLRPAGEAGELPSSSLAGNYLPGVTSEVFIRKYLDVRATIAGRLTTIGLEGGNYRRTYPNSPEKNERDLHAGITLTRRLGLTTALRAGYGHRDLEVTQFVGGTGAESSYRLEWLRTMSRTLTLAAAVGRLTATGTTAPHEVNFAVLRLGKTF